MPLYESQISTLGLLNIFFLCLSHLLLACTHLGCFIQLVFCCCCLCVLHTRLHLTEHITEFCCQKGKTLLDCKSDKLSPLKTHGLWPYWSFSLGNCFDIVCLCYTFYETGHARFSSPSVSVLCLGTTEEKQHLCWVCGIYAHAQCSNVD